jgi:predicted aspartyl protease
VAVIGPGNLFRDLERAILDTGADDTVFPLDVAQRLGIRLRPATGHGLRWRVQVHALRFGDADLELTDMKKRNRS